MFKNLSEKTKDNIFNIIGIIGVSIVLIAYFMLQNGNISSNDLSYSVANLIGSILIFISLLRNWNMPSAVIQICFVAISLFGIFKVL